MTNFDSLLAKQSFAPQMQVAANGMKICRLGSPVRRSLQPEAFARIAAHRKPRQGSALRESFFEGEHFKDQAEHAGMHQRFELAQRSRVRDMAVRKVSLAERDQKMMLIRKSVQTPALHFSGFGETGEFHMRGEVDLAGR